MSIIENLLPYDGEVFYFSQVLNEQKSNESFQSLLTEIKWENDELLMYGKRIVTKRKVAWYGLKPYNYTYSKINKQAHLYSDILNQLQQLIEGLCKENFNSCLLNLYHDGSEGMGWHSDNEKELKKNGTIASLSFGANRIFQFKHKLTKEIVNIELENSSLLMMNGVTQEHWLHALKVDKKIKTPRINLTFRTIVD